jgi:hypothetical protein
MSFLIGMRVGLEEIPPVKDRRLGGKVPLSLRTNFSLLLV